MKIIRPLILIVSLTTFSASLVLISCGPMPVKETEKPELIRHTSLIRYYRDLSIQQADRNYTGHNIQVIFDPGEYDLGQYEIHYHGGVPDSPPILIFECQHNLKTNTKKIVISGMCLGKTVDGKNRDLDVNFYIVIQNCSLVVR